MPQWGALITLEDLPSFALRKNICHSRRVAGSTTFPISGFAHLVTLEHMCRDHNFFNREVGWCGKGDIDNFFVDHVCRGFFSQEFVVVAAFRNVECACP